MAKFVAISSRVHERASKVSVARWVQSPLLWCVLGFFLGRAAIFGEMWPLGLAYLAAWGTRNSKRSMLFPILGVSVGTLTVLGFRLALPYLAAFALLGNVPMESKQAGKNWLIFSCLFLKTGLHYLLTPQPIVVIIGLAECVLGVFSLELIHFALHHCLNEQLAYVELMAIFSSSVLIVASDWNFGGFSARLFLIFVLIALASRLGGIRLACIVGPALALVSLLLGEPTSLALLMVVASLLTGLLNNFKWGYFIGPIFAVIFSSSSPVGPETMQHLVVIFGASLVGLKIPQNHLDVLARIVPGTEPFVHQNKGYDQHLKQVLDQKIDQYLSVFEELERTLIDNENPLFHKQMQSMAELLKTMKSSFAPDIHFTKEFEQKLFRRFAKEEMDHITVLKSLDGFEIYGARKHRCAVGNFCRDVATFCSGTLESRRYGVTGRGCSEGGACGFKVAPCPSYKLEIGRANLASQEISGDSQITFEVGSSKVAIVLSDGMGVGHKAHTESNVAVRLLECMITAGYDLTTAVSLINRLLMLRNQEDMFVTIDLVVVDLFSGQLEFVKIGSAPSFIKRGREVEIIHNHALPVGVLAQVDVESDRRILKEGEVLVMATDGVLDAQRKIARKDEWMCWNLRRLHNSGDMAAMAASILADSLEVAEGQVHDDMMVVVARLVKADWEIESYRRAQTSVL